MTYTCTQEFQYSLGLLMMLGYHCQRKWGLRRSLVCRCRSLPSAGRKDAELHARIHDLARDLEAPGETLSTRRVIPEASPPTTPHEPVSF